jgi:hypothetical protein
MKEISQRMARMVITTISSTKVKAHFELKVESLKLKGVKVLKSKPPSPNPFLLDRRQGKKFKVLLHFH